MWPPSEQHMPSCSLVLPKLVSSNFGTSLLPHGEIKIKRQPGRIHLLVGVLTGVVVVLVVRIELHMLAYGEQGARVKRRGTPFAVLALRKGLCGDIRNEVIRADRKGALAG
jgi:hypothetical protein